MVDPLTAFGAASSIIQIVTFTSDLISKGREIYKSADGTLIEYRELEAITTSLRQLNRELVHPVTGSSVVSGRKSLRSTEAQFHDLLNGCSQVAEELLEVIEKLKVKGPHMKWNTFRQALNTVWKAEKIEALEIRLDRYRRQIDTTLLLSLKESIQKIVSAPSYQLPERQPVSSLMLPSELGAKQWQKDLVEALYQKNWQLQYREDVAKFSSTVSARTKEEIEDLYKSQIVGRLRFSSIGDRVDGIANAHRKTFDWMFLYENDLKHFQKAGGKHRQWSNFVQWLHDDSALYWITGKPGSGKSTLMKYLHDDRRMVKHLMRWCKDLPLVTAGFFFWNSGTTMQMSKLGLLQTLLHDTIKDNLKVVPVLFPERWKSYMFFGGDLRPWSMSELLQAFKTLISDNSKKFFFLIDGLDEFDGDGAELVNFIFESLSSKTNVKMCVASRPWLVFEDAFQRRPSLRLEDLTAQDIHLFISEHFQGSEMFVNLQKLQPDNAELLITEVTEKASGVFLWVRLVVMSLLEGLRDGDSFVDLQERLLQLPADLEELFFKILKQLNPTYFKQASALFQLVRAASGPPSLFFLSLAEEGLERALAYAIKPISDDETSFRAETMRRRLNSRCKGLIEAPKVVSDGPSAKVQYLHRTVRDYLNKPDVWEYIVSRAENDFDPHIAWAGAFLLQIKTMKSDLEMLNSYSHRFRSCVNISTWLDYVAKDAYIPVLDELERVSNILWPYSNRDGTTWLDVISEHKIHPTLGQATLPWDATNPTDLKIAVRPRSVFDYAFQYPLYEYVQYRLDGGYPLHSRVCGSSMLMAATIGMDVQMLQILFKYGSDPNRSERNVPDPTPWHYTISKQDYKPPGTKKWLEITHLFLDNGADLQTKVYGESVDAVIVRPFRGLDPVEKMELLRKVALLKAAQKGQKRGSRGLGGFFKRFND